MRGINIAIDGPSGAGKSTIARALSKKLDILHLDTGSLYRAVGLFAAQNNVDRKDRVGVARLLDDLKIEVRYADGNQQVLIDGLDITGKLRTPLMSLYASDVSAVPKVREFLLDLQRRIARENDCVLDGRDIGTVVLPDAGLKIYLTATPKARAQRRYDELIRAGEAVEYSDVLADIMYRDQNDSTRPNSPLRSAPDAVMIDSTNLTLEETIEIAYKIARDRFTDVL